LRLTKFEGNPVIAPRGDVGWESVGTFNPGAVVYDGFIHLLYRAVDEHGISRLGYARTVDGRIMESRSPEPVMVSSGDWEEFGCEDPRITRLDGKFYVTYTAYSRRGPRLALASTKDFIHFEKYGLVGPDRDDKDCVIFPERIGGRVALLHRLGSSIQIAYFDSIESLTKSQNFWSEYLTHVEDHEILRGKLPWEEGKVGAGSPPLKTERGWLVIYHGVSTDRIYCAGAFLLDLDDPKKVLARTRVPILQPEKDFEKQGFVPNVVFPDGAVVNDGELLTYYGGGDRVCCVASAPLDGFLDALENEN
jgi:predicted GH43/DUF377 family glycosyl hydrolase